jgi:hypothetical protein
MSLCPCFQYFRALSKHANHKDQGSRWKHAACRVMPMAQTTFDTTVRWFLVNQTMQRLTHCFEDLFDQSLLVVAACVFVSYRLFATLPRQSVASRRHHLPHQPQNSLSRFTIAMNVFSASYIAPIQRPGSRNPS